MATPLCDVCSSMFTDTRNFDRHFYHHGSVAALRSAASQGCYMCRTIAKELDTSTISLDKDYFVCYLSRIGDPLKSFSFRIETRDHRVPNSEGGATFRPHPVQFWFWTLLRAEYALPLVRNHEPPESFDSPILANLARSWRDRCRTHKACNAHRGNGFAPSRLLNLASGDDHDRIKLCVAIQVPLNEPYATLSHRWGMDQTPKLRDDNLDDLCTGIRIDSLPVSYREAIKVARWFGIQYLWIDSLCIIQNDREDWLNEASRMGDVYKHSELNIAATGATDSTQPCLSDRDTASIKPGYLTTSWDAEMPEDYVLTRSSLRDREIDQSPLRTRAWVLQEIMLAPRVLNLGVHQMWWECRSFEACETFPNGVPQDSARMQPTFKRDDRGYFDVTDFRTNRYEDLAAAYSACVLSFETDRVIAFAGIAELVQKSSQDTYIAGMFSSQLPGQLLWQPWEIFESSPPNAVARRPAEWRAPSWSWLSIEGPIRFDYAPGAEPGACENQFVASVIDVHLKYLDPNHPWGIMLDGWIQLSGPVVDLEFVPSSLDYDHMVIGYPDRENSLVIRLPFGPANEDLRRGYYQPVEIQWDVEESGGMGNKLSCIGMAEYRYKGVDVIHCLLLRSASREGNDSQAYCRVGHFVVMLAELLEVFKRPSSERIVTIY